MNYKGFIDGMLANYPEALHPTDMAIKDMMRTVKALRYDDRQMQAVYDEVLKRSQFFPRINDVIEAASGLCFQVTGQKPKYEVRWKTWEGENGYCYAQRDGFIQWEAAEREGERYQREACSTEEGVEAFREGLRQSGCRDKEPARRVAGDFESASAVVCEEIFIDIEYEEERQAIREEGCRRSEIIQEDWSDL